jgi:PhzF family phenazine biosynthesis protein
MKDITMKISIFQVDAFTNQAFSGNPAAVCPLDYWLTDENMQAIAGENNLSETAFIVNRGDYYQIRWFTPQTEVDLCGHATLASAWVIMNKIQPDVDQIKFGSRGGELKVRRDGEYFLMDFPVHPPKECVVPNDLIKALGQNPVKVMASNYYLAIYDSEEEVRKLKPYMALLKELDRIGVIITAPGESVDFVSRFFAPAVGIPEDPVTGSAHCTLIPYWAEMLNKTSLTAKQVSCRGGDLICEYKDDRVIIGGQARLFMEGRINF